MSGVDLARVRAIADDLDDSACFPGGEEADTVRALCDEVEGLRRIVGLAVEVLRVCRSTDVHVHRDVAEWQAAEDALWAAVREHMAAPR